MNYGRQTVNLPPTKKNADDWVYKSSLKIASWNVNGLGGADLNKLKDQVFTKHIKQHDIIAILETHCPKDKTVFIPGYKTHQCYVNYSGKKEIGGIALLIKNELWSNVPIIKDSKDYVWFKLNKSFFSLEKDLYVCAAYIPPEKSKYLKLRNEQDILVQIADDIANYSEQGHVLLMGDLNGRTGVMKDYISDDSDTFNTPNTIPYQVDQDIGDRLSQDDQPQSVNPRGKQIIDLCVQSRLRILNGRSLGDTYGYFTCHRSNGSSVVDYMLANEELMHRILCFKVHPLQGGLSDHCMISSLLKSNFSTQNIKQIPQSTGHTFQWKEEDVENYQNALTSPEIQKKIKLILSHNYDTTTDINKAVTDMSDILIKTADKSLRRTGGTSHKKQKPNKPWFDKSLASMRKELMKKAKLLGQFPTDPQVRGSYYKFLKQYNRNRKYKQRLYKQNIVTKLDHMRVEKPSEFWKILDLLKSEETRDNPATNISLEEWGHYFRELNNSSTAESNPWGGKTVDVLKNIQHNTLDEPIQEQEIVDAIKKLKNRKAQGPDTIRNEMLKYSQHALLPCLKKIFNIVLQSGQYPDEWARGYISPLFKTGNPFIKDNYRGITITSCLGKLFNSIMNSRIDKHLKSNNTIPETQIAYKANSRTSDHIFVLKSMIDKQLKKERKPLYACFIDFKKAFDSIPHEALFYKLATVGIGGNTHNLIRDMYKKTQLCVKVGSQMSNSFPSNIGVRQGDNLSPTLFKIYTHDLPDIVDHKCDAPTLDTSKVGCLLFADDAVVLSTSASGLQQELHNLQHYCQKWELTVNTSKTKVMVFSPSGRKTSPKITYDDKEIECVNEYKYLGTLLTSGGQFTKTCEDLYKRGLKAFFKLRKYIARSNIKCSTYMHLFETVVKPVLMYGSEVWGPCIAKVKKLKADAESGVEECFQDLPIEKLHTLLCRTILGVNARTTKMALYSETGRYPLYIDAITTAVKYLKRIEAGDCSTLLNESLKCNIKLAQNDIPCWYGSLNNILSSLKLTDPNTGDINYALKCRFDSYWFKSAFTVQNPTGNSGKKLRTYQLFKTNIHKEEYLDNLTSTTLRSALARFRIGAHNLNIEMGRYIKQPVNERLCKMCSDEVVEDEPHFLTECITYITEREKLFDCAQSQCKNFNKLDNHNKFIWLLSADSPPIIKALAEFLRSSFALRNRSLGLKY
jgi:exonuclease III